MLGREGDVEHFETGGEFFIDPKISLKIIEGIEVYCTKHGFSAAKDLVGAME